MEFKVTSAMSKKHLDFEFEPSNGQHPNATLRETETPRCINVTNQQLHAHDPLTRIKESQGWHIHKNTETVGQQILQHMKN